MLVEAEGQECVYVCTPTSLPYFLEQNLIELIISVAIVTVGK